MTIPPVTSLADLEFKAKADKHYQQLTILGCNSINYSNVKLYSTAIERLHKLASENGNCCQTVIYHVNRCCNKIKPEVDSVTVAKKKKAAEAAIEKLKKLRKGAVTKKTVKKIRRRVSVTV